MLSFNLPTFVKICHLDNHQMLNEIEKKLNPKGDGHSFHWSLKKAIHAHIDGASKEDINDILDTPSRPAERTHNRTAYENFEKRFGKVQKIEKIEESEVYAVAEHGIEIRVEPWFSTEENGKKFLHVVWAIASIKLERRNANIGCFILRETFKSSKWGNSTFCIMDLTSSKRYSDKTVTEKTPTALGNVCALISRCAKQV